MHVQYTQCSHLGKFNFGFIVLQWKRKWNKWIHFHPPWKMWSCVDMCWHDKWNEYCKRQCKLELPLVGHLHLVSSRLHTFLKLFKKFLGCDIMKNSPKGIFELKSLWKMQASISTKIINQFPSLHHVWLLWSKS
jgi:hypothetical protein